MKYVYIAGPYMGATHDHRSYHEIERNIGQAREAAAELAKRGIGFFCPHTHSAHFEVIVPEAPAAYWYELDLHFLTVCDAVLLLPGWWRSAGAKREARAAGDMGMPVFALELDEAYERIERWATTGEAIGSLEQADLDGDDDAKQEPMPCCGNHWIHTATCPYVARVHARGGWIKAMPI